MNKNRSRLIIAAARLRNTRQNHRDPLCPKRIAILVLLTTSGAVWLRSQTPAPLEFDFSVQRSTVSLGEPVVILFRASNHSPQVQSVDLGINRQGAFAFAITSPEGSFTQIDGTSIAYPETVRVSHFSIGVNESYSQRIYLSEWYSFSRTGEYTIHPAVTSIAAEKDFNRTMTVRITGPEVGSLRATCEQLAEKALHPFEPGAVDAARELSYIKDAVCRPSFERMLHASTPVMRSWAIDALAHLSTKEALDDLIEVLRSTDDLDRSRAFGRLWEIEQRTPDDGIRQLLTGAGVIGPQ